MILPSRWLAGCLADSWRRVARILERLRGLRPGLRKGLMVAAMDHRLAPEHPWPVLLDDVLAAIAFLRSRTTDPTRIALWVTGGHLAMMAALTSPSGSAVWSPWGHRLI